MLLDFETLKLVKREDLLSNEVAMTARQVRHAARQHTLRTDQGTDGEPPAPSPRPR
jgi:hypothetical protein